MGTDGAGRVSAALALLSALSCATAGPGPPAPGPAPASAPPVLFEPRTSSVPDEVVRPPGVRLLDSTRFTLNVQDADLRALLLGLGRDSPLNIVVEPGVSGAVTADLEDVSLLEILEQIVVPRGLYWAVEGSVLRVFRTDRETRTWSVDYPSYVRTGSSAVNLGGFVGSTPGLSENSAEKAEDSSSATLETTQSLDFWTELEGGLRTIVFGAPDATSDAEQAPAEGDGAPAALPARRVFVSRNSGLVTVTAEGSLLGEVEGYLKAVARSFARQVLIDVEVLEITLSDDLDFGLEFEGAPDLGDSTTGVFTRKIEPGDRPASLVQTLAPLLLEGGFSFGIAREGLGVILRSLALQTDIRVVSTPRITTLNNHKALIKVVRNEVFFVAEVENIITDFVVQQTTEFVPQIVPVGITLDVTPQISGESEITMHIHPSVSEIVDLRIQPTSDPDLPQNGSLPVVNIRETDTVLRVQNDATIVLGGLIQSREFDQERRTPFLGSIPALGWLFRRTETAEKRTELVILMTPRIMDAPRIARVTDEARESLRAVDDMRLERAPSPWWRYPRGASYGVAP